jgi:glycosyltransferase involved in cell wall biosynthesis
MMLARPDPRIVHVTECLASGTMNFLMQATRELAAAGASQVLVYSRRPDTPADVRKLFDPRVEMIELPPLGRSPIAFARALRKTVLAQLYDAAEVTIHLHSSKAGFLGRLALVGLRRRPRMYYSPHGLSFLNRRYVAPSVAFRALEWLAARAVPCTPVGCSQGEAALLSLISPTPAQVLENAVDDAFFDVQRGESTPPVVVTMGRVCYQKAPERFAQMAVRFQLADVPARFVWIGNGDQAAEAKLRAAGVHVTGWVDQAQVKRLLAEASIYVQTSRWEGMPLSVLQALAAGLPCVVTDVVGNRDAVRQGITGFVVDDTDAMLVSARRLLKDPELRERFSIAARQDAVERFAGSSFRLRLCRLYGLADRTLHLPKPAAVPSRLGLASNSADKAARPDWPQQANG